MLSTSLDLNIVVSLMMAASAVNSAIKINYAGTGNSTQFVYNGVNLCCRIIETTSGTTTNTKQFVLDNDKIREVRDGTGTLVSQCFDNGQTISGGNYFYTKDHSLSVKELTDSSGNVSAEYSYSPYGQSSKLFGTLDSDFQFAGYYYHARSGLNLAAHRAYNSNLGRWINRDPSPDESAENPFLYVSNSPTNYIDPTGNVPLALGGLVFIPGVGEVILVVAGGIAVLGIVYATGQIIGPGLLQMAKEKTYPTPGTPADQALQQAKQMGPPGSKEFCEYLRLARIAAQAAGDRNTVSQIKKLEIALCKRKSTQNSCDSN